MQSKPRALDKGIANKDAGKLDISHQPYLKLGDGAWWAAKIFIPALHRRHKDFDRSKWMADDRQRALSVCTHLYMCGTSQWLSALGIVYAALLLAFRSLAQEVLEVEVVLHLRVLATQSCQPLSTRDPWGM